MVKAKNTDRTERQGVHLVGLKLERAGFAEREQAASDYGIDSVAELIENEAATGRLLAIQIKSGSSYLHEKKNGHFIYRPDAAHVAYWLTHSLPVILCLCDIENETVYWQRLAVDTVEKTGKGYKVTVPETQVLQEDARSKLVDAMTHYVASTEYTLISTEDVSHGLAKRYSVRIVLNRSMTKPEMAVVVREVTARTAKRRYSRDDIVKRQWGDTDAHVVWTFVFSSAEDEKRSAYVCRSEWIDSKLSPDASPLKLIGEDIGDGIIVDWEKSPLTYFPTGSKDFDKEQYLAIVQPVITVVLESVEIIDSALADWNLKTNDDETFLEQTENALKAIDQKYHKYSSSPVAPFECADLDISIRSFLSLAQNIPLYHNEKGCSIWQPETRRIMTMKAINDVRKLWTRIEFELEKIK
nr:DUF4365 domain-containing protein [uncultured Desulfobulbus sp.]